MLAFVVWNVPFILTPFFGTVLRLVLPLLAMVRRGSGTHSSSGDAVA